jgi:WD40 repeat protein
MKVYPADSWQLESVAKYWPFLSVFHLGSFISCAEFSPNGQFLVLCDTGKDAVYIVETRRWNVIRTIDNVPKPYELSFTANGRELAVGTMDGVLIVRAVDWTLERKIGRTGDERYVVLPNGEVIAFFARSPATKSWNTMEVVTKSGSKEVSIRGRWDFDGAVAVSRDGSYLAVGDDQYVKVVDTTTWKVAHTISLRSHGFRGMVNDISFSPDGKLVAFSNDNHSPALIYAAPDWRSYSAFSNGLPGFDRIVFCSNSKWAYTFSVSSGIGLWNVRQGRLVGTWHRNGQYSAGLWDGAVSPDGAHLVILNEVGQAEVWRLPAGSGARFR